MKLASIIILSAVLLGGCFNKVLNETASFPAVIQNKEITHLKVEVDAGDFIIAPSADETIKVEAELRYRDARPEPKVVIEGSTMHLIMECPDDSLCHGHFHVTVPVAITADVGLGAGSVEIRDLTGKLEISSGAGNISLTGVSGELDLQTGAGNVTVTDCESTTYTVNTGAGNITLKARNAPDRANLTAGVGKVALEVPKASYDLTVSTGVGPTRVVGVVTDDSSSHVIDANAGVGKVSVKGI